MTPLRFTAIDTWFFRESRPFDAIGGSELASVFPPPPRTLMGAVRTAIGESFGADWRAFGRAPNHYALANGSKLRDLIGYGDDCGPLSLNGPWPSWQGKRLYPVPAAVLGRGEGDQRQCVRLRIGAAARTRLKRVRLPQLPPGNAGAKTLDNAWLSANGLQNFLNGTTPSAADVSETKKLLNEEPRLGIARDNARRTAADGLLYQTRHLRPESDLAIEVDVKLPLGIAPPHGLIRFGGEGRLAHIEQGESASIPAAPTPTTETRGLILILLTPAAFPDGAEGWLPPGFRADEEDGVRVWKGSLHDIPLTLHAAAIGKPVREGGWDVAARLPRPVRSLIPAGSCFYVTTPVMLADAIDVLHDTHIGEDTHLGRGHIACGLWNANEF